jgi:hypothetical protein
MWKMVFILYLLSIISFLVGGKIMCTLFAFNAIFILFFEGFVKGKK